MKKKPLKTAIDTDTQLETMTRTMAKYRKDKKAGFDFLVRAGIYTRKGNLTAKYR